MSLFLFKIKLKMNLFILEQKVRPLESTLRAILNGKLPQKDPIKTFFL